MLTPFDWQEGIGNRAGYVESRLKHGSPVLAVSLQEGMLVFTRRKQGRKLFEVYDRLLFTAIGQQGDMESMRTAAVDFAHQEGYQRSEEDVTVQRVVTALSQPVKRAFGDFNSAPYVLRSLFAELGDQPEADRYFVLDFDGDYRQAKKFAALAGSDESRTRLEEGLASIGPETAHNAALKHMERLWKESQEDEQEEKDWTDEALLIERDTVKENRFHWLLGAEV